MEIKIQCIKNILRKPSKRVCHSGPTYDQSLTLHEGLFLGATIDLYNKLPPTSSLLKPGPGPAGVAVAVAAAVLRLLLDERVHVGGRPPARQVVAVAGEGQPPRLLPGHDEAGK